MISGLSLRFEWGCVPYCPLHLVLFSKMTVPYWIIYCPWEIIIHSSYRGKDGQGEEVIKPYTPITLDSDVGYFELVIKVCIFWFLFDEQYFNGMHTC